MYLPPLQPIANSEIQICGDVEIHPTASIAPGVILKASSNFRIVIGADVCLGMGVILSAANGSIEIEAGVALGSGVLIIGSSKIGANSCIGTTTTIFNASIAPMTVINPGSIIGDNSRSWQEENNDQEIATTESTAPKTETISHNQEITPENQPEVANEINEIAEINSEITNLESNSHDTEVAQQDSPIFDQEETNPSATIADFDPWESEDISKLKSQIEVENNEQNPEIAPGVAIGKVYIDQLLVTLFPHKNSLNNNSSNNGK